MVEGLLGYVDAHGRAERESALRPAIAAAAVHGESRQDTGPSARPGGLPPASVGTSSTTSRISRGSVGLDTPQATRILVRANEGVDRLIVALVEAYAATERRVEEAG